MDAEDLKPCPLCGGRAELVEGPYDYRCTTCLGIPSDPDTPFCQWCGARVTGGSLWDAQGREASFDTENIVFRATAWAECEDDVRNAMRDQIDRAAGGDAKYPIE